MSLPEKVLAKVREISTNFGVPEEKVLEVYMEYFKSDFVQTDPQFKNDDERHEYCMRAIWVKFAAGPPSEEYEVIPIGMKSPRRSKVDGTWRGQIYALIKQSKELSPGVIFVTGSQVSIFNELRPFFLYKTRLSNWGGNRYSTTSFTSFKEGKMLTVSPIDLVRKVLKVKEIKIADTPYAISRMKDEKFVDEWDLRLIRGIVLRYSKGGDEETGQWAFYVIGDESVRGEPSVTDTGIIIPNQLTVWVPPQFLKYDKDSELYFLGTITLADKEPRMNAICVIPIHAKILMEE